MTRSNSVLIAVIVLVLGVGGFLFYQKIFTEKTAVPGSADQKTQRLVPVTEGVEKQATKKNYHQEIDIDARSFFFNPDAFLVKKGEKVTLRVHSYGDHAFTIHDLKINERTPDGKVTTIEFTPQKEGAYRFYCPIPGHAEAGMTGVIMVE